MSIQHRELAQGRWYKLSFVEQMANVGGEVERALNWKAKNDGDYSRQAVERALELMGFTLDDPRNRARLKELARAREAIVDYFYGGNEFVSSESLWRGYFSCFAFAARRDR